MKQNSVLGAVIAITAASFTTGALLIPKALELRLDWSMPGTLTGGQHVLVAAAHVAAGFAVAVLLGLLWTSHVRRYWEAGRNRWSGSGILLVWLALFLTGIGVLYLGNETISLVASVSHTMIGIVVPILLAAHVFLGRSSRPRPVARPRHHHHPRIRARSTDEGRSVAS